LEEPSVLSCQEPVFKDLLDGLACFFTCLRFLECILRNDAFQAFEFESVASGHEVVVIDDFDKGLYTGPFVDALAAHALGNLLGVAVDASDDGVGKRV